MSLPADLKLLSESSIFAMQNPVMHSALTVLDNINFKQFEINEFFLHFLINLFDFSIKM